MTPCVKSTFNNPNPCLLTNTFSTNPIRLESHGNEYELLLAAFVTNEKSESGYGFLRARTDARPTHVHKSTLRNNTTGSLFTHVSAECRNAEQTIPLEEGRGCSGGIFVHEQRGISIDHRSRSEVASTSASTCSRKPDNSDSSRRLGLSHMQTIPLTAMHLPSHTQRCSTEGPPRGNNSLYYSAAPAASDRLR